MVFPVRRGFLRLERRVNMSGEKVEITVIKDGETVFQNIFETQENGGAQFVLFTKDEGTNEMTMFGWHGTNFLEVVSIIADERVKELSETTLKEG
jgi:hypothetical protein